MDVDDQDTAKPSAPTIRPEEGLFLSLFENAAVAIVVATIDGNALQVNPATCTLLGYTCEELLRLNVLDITHPDDRQRTRELFQAAANGEIPVFHYEKRYLRRDGSVLWGLTTVSCLQDENGKPGRCVALIQDITARRKAEESLIKSEELYRTLVENIELGISLVTADHRIVMINPAMARLFHKPADQFVGRQCFMEFEKTVEACPHCPGTLALASGHPETVVTEGRRDDGSFAARIQAFPLLGPEGHFDRFIEVVENITEKRRTEQALLESERRFRSLFLNASIGLAIVDPRGRYLEVNPAFCAFLGYSEAELRQMTVEEVTLQDEKESTCEILRSAIAGEVTRFSIEKAYRHKSGAAVWGRVNSVWIADENGNPAYGIGLVEDVTQRKQTENELLARQKDLDHLAYHDSLTGLPNRLLLQDRLQHALAKARRAGSKVALIFLDLDRFKIINETFGHEVGDRILCEVARRLQSLVRECDTLTRFGGDEFIVVLEELPEPKIAGQFARQILDTLSAAIEVKEANFHLGGSIGISLFPHNGGDVETLLKCGEVAMYRAKEKGRNTYQFYAPDMNVRTRELILLENSLRQALSRKEFVLYYQPQVDLSSGQVLGVEALVRWRHPDFGLLSPDDFIPLAEETGLIVPIGEWILRGACLQAREWRQAGFPALRIGVNISPRQFRSPHLAEHICNILRETDMESGLLDLELTESMVMPEVETAIRTMHELVALGVQLSIDDFGTGYSSLHYLRRFPIRRLKIDREFVRDVTTSANDAAIASAVIALARTMALEVIAEGIETREQLGFLQQKGCHIGQGYLLCRPLPAGELVDLLRHGSVPVA